MNERKPRRPSDGIERAPASSNARRRADGTRARAGGASRGSKPEKGARASTGDAAKRRAPRGAQDGRDRRSDSRAAGDSRRTGRRSDGDDRSRRRPQRDDERRGGRPRSGGRRGDTSGRGADGRGKRTSRNSDERNPTRSGIDYPSPKYRAKQKDADAAAGARERPALRKVRRPASDSATSGRTGRTRKPTPAAPTPRRRRSRRTQAGDELNRLAGRGARHAQADLERAAEAFAGGRERDAARLLRPLRDLYPDASAVRELLGLSQYRLGQYAAATKELEAFVDLTGSVDQHPVLMDCARALGRYARVEELWEELAAASPSAALVSEGRIVLAGARADQGRLHEAIATLDRRRGTPGRVQEHHLRVWYALADLYERAGELPKARELFLRVRRHDAAFADVAERLAALN